MLSCLELTASPDVDLDALQQMISSRIQRDDSFGLNVDLSILGDEVVEEFKAIDEVQGWIVDELLTVWGGIED